MAKTLEYQLSTTWTGVNKGKTTDASGAYSREFTVKCEGRPDVVGSADVPFKGDPTLYNPELLLLSALSSCHMLSYLYLCAVKNIHIVSYVDDSTGKIELSATGAGFFTEAVMTPTVVISEDSDLELAKKLHEDAHEKCFIANSVNFSVRVVPIVMKK